VRGETIRFRHSRRGSRRLSALSPAGASTRSKAAKRTLKAAVTGYRRIYRMPATGEEIDRLLVMNQ